MQDLYHQPYIGHSVGNREAGRKAGYPGGPSTPVAGVLASAATFFAALA